MTENEDTTTQTKPEQDAPKAESAPVAQDSPHDVVEAAPTASQDDVKTGPYEVIEVKEEPVVHETTEEPKEGKIEEPKKGKIEEPTTLAAQAPSKAAPISLGKLYRGDVFPNIKTPEMVEAERLEQEKYNHPDAVPLEVYFAVRGISDVGAQAARRRSTTVQQATLEKWDEIFGASF